MRTFSLLALSAFLASHPAQAHVKWFSRYRYDQAPSSFESFATPTFLGLLALTLVTIGLIVLADRWFERWPKYQTFNRWLESFSDRAPILLRVFTGASILLAWEADAMVAPELTISSQATGWYQFGLCLLLLGRTTTPLAGLGMIGLYFYAMTQYSFFHLLDYMVYPAIGYFLITDSAKDARIRGTRIPALYLGLGFSLCWAALEKIFYPNWGLEALSQHPALTMGLDPSFFLMACAFVEIGLGFMLIVGLIERPLALTITLTFFTTTAFFGKTEVVGHTILHGALLVFIILGVGNYYRPPIAIHRRLSLRVAFACVNFVVVLGVLGTAYHALSTRAYEMGGMKTPYVSPPALPADAQDVHDHGDSDHGHSHDPDDEHSH